MDLKIAQREKERIVILDLKGEFVLGDDHLLLLQRLLFLLDSRRKKVIVNLQEVPSIDASLLATLAFCARLFHDIEGRLVLLNPGLPHTQVADMELNTALESYPEETDAMNSFFPDRVVPRYDILEFVKEQQQVRDRNSEALKTWRWR
jgi:anti-sigma B factor antagonist